MKTAPLPSRGAFPLPGRIPGAACGVGGHGAFTGRAGVAGLTGAAHVAGVTGGAGGIGHGREGGFPRLGGVGGGGGGHDRGARGRFLGDHAAGMVADVGCAAAAREQGRRQSQDQRKAQDLFHSNTSCQNADGASLPQGFGDKQGNFYEKENF